MSGLITLLKKQHNEMNERLKRVKNLGVTSEEGQRELLAMKASLIAHLKAEDEQLYPALKKAAETDSALGRLIDQYITEMDEITVKTLDFFDKYSTGGSGMEFARDYGKLVGSLSTRMRNEENTLYKRYDAIATH